MRERHLVVVGASLAGLRAVEAARNESHRGPVTLVGAEPHPPYDRPPLSKAFLARSDVAPDVPRYREEVALRDDLGVTLALGEPATGLDTGRREVLVGEQRVGYDALVIATGMRPRSLPGAEGLAGVHPLRTVEDARAIRVALDSGARAVIVGAGFVGSEVASAARERELDVTIVEALPAPLTRALGTAMGEVCAELHRANGTALRCGTAVVAVEGDGRVERVVLSDGTALEADLVVVGTGAQPATSWLHGSGLDLDDGVGCDETLAAGPHGVYAAGDVARWPNPLFEVPMRLEHWTSAAEQGAHAARNALAPEQAKPYATVPYFWSDWYGTRIQFVGSPVADEVRVVSGNPADFRFVALYRYRERLVGALAVDRQGEIMKYRARIAQRITWDDALRFAAERAAGAARSAAGR